MLWPGGGARMKAETAGCPYCQERGLIIHGNFAVPCRCMQQKALANRWREALLPPRMRSCTFANFNLRYYSRELKSEGATYYEKARAALQAARNFVEEFKTNPHTDGLLFAGAVGSGKTFLACCVANALLADGYTVLFVVVPDWLDKLYEAQRSGEEESDVLTLAREVPLLILDDLGAHNYNDWVRNRLYSLLNYRLNYCLPVIVTTNLGLEELSAKLGNRITSRLLQMCRPYQLVVEMDIRLVERLNKYWH